MCSDFPPVQTISQGVNINPSGLLGSQGSPDLPAPSDGDLLGETTGFAQPNGILHLETIQLRRYTGYWDMLRKQRGLGRAEKMKVPCLPFPYTSPPTPTGVPHMCAPHQGPPSPSTLSLLCANVC